MVGLVRGFQVAVVVAFVGTLVGFAKREVQHPRLFSLQVFKGIGEGERVCPQLTARSGAAGQQGVKLQFARRQIRASGGLPAGIYGKMPARSM